MGQIMNSPRGLKSGVPETVSISCATYGTRHDIRQNKLETSKINMCDTEVSNL